MNLIQLILGFIKIQINSKCLIEQYFYDIIK